VSSDHRRRRVVNASASVVAELGTVPELGIVLGVWANPDNEAYLSGG
jgi:hypothetical protein